MAETVNPICDSDIQHHWHATVALSSQRCVWCDEYNKKVCSLELL